ncbi:cytochrome b/b6 domain-containing protein [Paraglaciecola marina]|uniref:cytochrome b/b6 domain-containing protein n=1 Tax=Paraglaciecola marina TaxID=2500157 RepID=UPI0023B2CCBE|nr:cytochrome b/b6 domain-containing protein [Paraglaciecola marina]
MVISGYAGTGTGTSYFSIFVIPKFEGTWLYNYTIIDVLHLDFQSFEKVADYIHKEILGALFMWLLILGHICAALYHHYINKDRTINKMTL